MDARSKKAFEKEFLTYHLQGSIPVMRIGLILTLCLFVINASINEALFPGSVFVQFFLRFGIIFPYLVISIALISIKPLRKGLNTSLTIVNFLVAIAIFSIGFFTNVNVKAYHFYYTWVGLVIVGVFTFYRIRFRNLMIIGTVLLFSYILAISFNKSFEADPEVFMSELLFVISMSSVGFFIAYIFEKKNRKDFSQQKVLAQHFANLRNEITKKEAAETALIQSQKKYHDAIDAIPDMVFVVDVDLRIVLVNAAFREWDESYNKHAELTGRRFSELYPELSDSFLEKMDLVFSTGINHISEVNYNHSGDCCYFEIRKTPILNNNHINQVMIIFRDVSKKKEVEQLKLKNVEQKEVMLREIHHRVKNNLAIVISLISIQIRNYPNPELKKPMKDIEMRIRSMALIHEYLYKSDILDRIPLSNYLYSLSSVIIGTLGQGNIRLATDIEPIHISIETALPLGLITNELITNAIKYAFPDHRDGELHIILKQEINNGGHYKLSISDNGVGLPPGFSLEKPSSTGMFIVNLLIEQLGAKLEIENKNGTSFHISFQNLNA
jgi:PAS domain S-box-containing protein